MSSIASNAAQLRLASSNSSDNSEHSTPPTSNEELMVGVSRAHFQKSYHEIKPLAEGANGETYLAIPRKAADKICAEVDGGQEARSRFFDALRDRIVVAKFPKVRRGMDEFENEMGFLTGLSKIQPGGVSVPIATMLDRHWDGEFMWLTLDFAQGGDLNAFVRNHRAELTLGLRWHFALELCNALAYLHHGVTDLTLPAPESVTDTAIVRDRSKSRWPHLYHGDFHTGNLLLAASGNFKDYPSLKLTDFGRARVYDPPKDPTSLASFNQKRTADIKAAGVILCGLMLAHHFGLLCANKLHCASDCGDCPRADCESCVGIGEKVKVSGLSRGEKEFWHAAERLRNFCRGEGNEGLEVLR